MLCDVPSANVQFFTWLQLCFVNAVTTGDANLDCTYYRRDHKPVVQVQRAVR